MNDEDLSQPLNNDEDLSQPSMKSVVNSARMGRSLNNLNPSAMWDTFKALSQHGAPLENLARNIGVQTMFLGPEVAAAKYGKGLANIAHQIGASIGKTGISAGLGTSVLPNETNEDALKSGLMGAGTAGVMTPLLMATSSLNPLTRILASLGVGGATGYGLGSATGHPATGSAIGSILGSLLGIRGGNISQLAAKNIEEALGPRDFQVAMQRERAAQDVGSGFRHSLPEATRSPALQKMEEEAIHHPGAASRAAAFYQQREISEPKAINTILNEVSSKENERKIDPLYTAARKANPDVDINSVVSHIDERLHQEPVNSKVYKTLQEAKSYLNPSQKTIDERIASGMTKEQANRPTNKLSDIVQIRKNISDLINTKQGNEVLGSEQKRELSLINDKLKEASTAVSREYEQGLNYASQKATRNEIEESLEKSERMGSNFYDKVLANDKEYNELFHKLRDPKNPNIITPAQKRLSAMRIAFKDLSRNLATQAGRAQAKTAVKAESPKYELLKSFINKIYMDRYHDAIAKILYSPDWHQELLRISKISSAEDRGIKLGRLISKVAVTGGVGYNQSMKQGSEQNGTGQ